MNIIQNVLLLIKKRLKGYTNQIRHHGALTNYMSKTTGDLAYKIGSLVIMVYYDAKKLVLPEYSFAIRAVVNMMAQITI